MALNAKEQLVRYLEDRLFRPVLEANPDGYSETRRSKLKGVQRSTQAEIQRFRYSGSAEEVVVNFKRDLHSDTAEQVHRDLRDLGLPTLHDVHGDFMKLAHDLGIDD